MLFSPTHGSSCRKILKGIIIMYSKQGKRCTELYITVRRSGLVRIPRSLLLSRRGCVGARRGATQLDSTFGMRNTYWAAVITRRGAKLLWLLCAEGSDSILALPLSPLPALALALPVRLLVGALGGYGLLTPTCCST